MNEYTILWTSVGALLGVVLASALYALGGRSGKWKRRFIASLVLASTVCVSSLIMGTFSWWFLLIYPILVGGFSLGYSGSNLAEKVLKRTLYTLAVVTAGVVCAVVLGGKAWTVLAIHSIIGATSIILGVLNPLYAASEETFICAVLNLGLVMYPFTVGGV